MERVMSELAINFAASKSNDVHVVLYGIKRDVFYSLPSNITLHKPEFEFTNKRRVWSTIKTLFFLREKIKNIHPDIVLSLGEYWNSFVLLSMLGLNYPVYVSDRCKPDKYLGVVHEKLRKMLYPSAAGIIAQTEVARNVYAQKKLNSNVRVIGNPIRQIKKSENFDKKKNIVLTVGRLIESKHHDRLIQIFSKIKNDDWKLVIVGGDALKQDGLTRLKELVKNMKLEDRVEFTGNVSDVDSYYLKSKIFALTSSSEGFPNVIGEAMSAGLPVVSYDCIAGPSEMIEDGVNGYLVPQFNDQLFLLKLEKLINDDDLREKMGSKGRSMIKNFSSEQISKKFYSFIAEYESTPNQYNT